MRESRAPLVQPARLGASTAEDHSTLNQRNTALLALGWSVVVGLVVFALFRAHGFDDPFITYRYSDNLARGLGFVYNPGERVLSTTTPLYTLLLIAPRLLHFDLPATSMAISSAALAAGGLCLFLLGQRLHTPIAGLVAMVLYPLTPLLLPTLGAETTLYCALILGGFWAYASERPMLTALLLALAALTRADGVLAAGIVGLHLVLSRKRLPWRALALYVALLAAWYLFAWVYFGSPLPATLAAKQRQGAMLISSSFAQGLLAQAASYWSQPLLRLHLIAAAVGAIYALGWRRGWLPLIAWGVIYTLAYSALGVTRYFWYYGPIAPALFALIGLGTEAVAAGLRPRSRWLAPVATIALGVALLWPLAVRVPGMAATVDKRLAIYQATGEWLRDNTPVGASVGTLEVGVIGFYAERPMIDFAGLLQPEVARQIGPTTTYGDLTAWAFTRYQPDYLVMRPPIPEQLAALPGFQAGCTPVHQLTDPAFDGILVIYQCRDL